MPEEVQSKGAQICEEEACNISAEASLAASELKYQSFTATESALQCEVVLLTRRAEELGGKFAKLCQECGRKVEFVLLERDGLQIRLDVITSELSGVSSSLTTAPEQLEKQCGRSAADQL